MKLIRIKYDDIGLFEHGISINFSAKDRVTDLSQVVKLYNNISVQRVLGIVGINASGKSTALRLVKFAMDIVLGQKSLGQLNTLQGIIKDETLLTVDFFLNDKFYRLESTLGIKKNPLDESNFDLYFIEEHIYSKNKSSVSSKNALFEYEENDRLYNRKYFENIEQSFLKHTDSIVALVLRDKQVFYADLLDETNLNVYSIKGAANMININLFDDSIASLKRDDEKLDVVFKSNQETHKWSTIIRGDELLSSGTIKGGNLLFLAETALKTGGYLLIDEIENHMHKELVLTIIDFFNDETVNKKGASLIFTTHYAEILDSFERKDNIYITLKNDDYSCEAIRFSDKVERNDIKKSEIFLSNYIDGTAPSYESIEKVREYLCRN